MRNVVGNWGFSPVYTYESPQATVQSAVDSNLNGDSAGDRAIFNPGGIAGTGSGVTPLCKSTLPSFATCGENDFDSAAGPPGPGNFDSTPLLVAYGAVNPNAQYIVVGPGAPFTSEFVANETAIFRQLSIRISAVPAKVSFLTARFLASRKATVR